MNELETVLHIDLREFILTFFAILIVIKLTIDLVGFIAKKFGIKIKYFEDKESDHKKLNELSERVKNLEKMQSQNIDSTFDSVYQTNSNVRELSKRLDEMMRNFDEIKESLESLRKTTETNTEANVELLYQKINEKCDHYINELQGVPNDEYMVLQSLFDKYTKLNGNHGLYKKVDYCLTNLPILPEKQL